MRALLVLPAIGLLAACEQTTPVAGAGFNTPQYQAQREAQLSGQGVGGNPLVPPGAISSEDLSAGGAPLDPFASQDPSAADIANETAAALASTSAQPTMVPVSPVEDPGNPAISDEQDFEAVSNRQTIESDAARIEQNRSNYEVVAPTAVPERGGESTPNIVQYAINTSNPVGTPLYSRAGFNLQAKAQRNCAKYPSPDQAQIDFLSNGGPQRDRKGLDPDGDGFACSWDPGPFRRAVNN
ncbi:hypothetical protein [Ruegeria sediminis]|nr:hypothetical protein [Ruegeria sediminis]